MTDGSRMQEFWSHWEHEPNATAEFARFRTRVTEVSRKLWGEYFRADSLSHRRETFALISGTSRSVHTFFDQSGLAHLLDAAKTLFDVAQAVQFFVWTAEEVLGDTSFDDCCRAFQRAFDLSPTIMIRLVRHGKTATLYPTGVRLLDEMAVESNLVWLSKFPQVLKPFEAALKCYMAKDPNQYRNMLDNLRFTLEEMLRAVLGNQKSLENQKEEFLRWLNEHDIHNRIGKMYHTLLFAGFADYQNEAVKHQEDAYTPAEVEFVLYMTGTFLRLIQRVSEQANTKAASPKKLALKGNSP
jgi:hypothetical protein